MRITINIKEAAEVDKVPYLRELIQLCHISNALNFMLRQTVQDNPDFLNLQAKYGLRPHLCILVRVHEAILTASSLLKKLAEIMPEFIRGEVAWILNEAKLETSFCNTVLAINKERGRLSLL